MLISAAATATAAAVHRTTFEPVSGYARNRMATAAAPSAWPNNRAVPSMPPAAPLRERGAADNSVRLLGDWKNPNPSPHKAMRQVKSATEPPEGNAASAASPAASVRSPSPPSMPAG